MDEPLDKRRRTQMGKRPAIGGGVGFDSAFLFVAVDRAIPSGAQPIILRRRIPFFT
jgi:hypothetical protein